MPLFVKLTLGPFPGVISQNPVSGVSTRRHIHGLPSQRCGSMQSGTYAPWTCGCQTVEMCAGGTPSIVQYTNSTVASFPTASLPDRQSESLSRPYRDPGATRVAPAAP